MAEVDPGGAGEGWSNRTQVKGFTDADGVSWRRRGGLVEGRALRRLVVDPAKRVLHEYAGQLTEVPAERREAFWREAEEAMAASPYSSFHGADFVSERHDRLVVVHEDC